MKTHYDLLGVPQDADPETVKAAYRKIVKSSHPDLHGNGDGAEIRSKQIIAAYAVLKDAEERARYDEQLRRRRGRFRWLATTALVSAGVAGAGALFFLDFLQTSARISPPVVALVEDGAAAAVSGPSSPVETAEAAPAPAASVAIASRPGPPDQPSPEAMPAPAPHEAAWLAIENSQDAGALWVFIRQYPGTPEAALAGKRLEPLIEAIDDLATLEALAAGATGSFAECVAARLGRIAAARDDSTAALPDQTDNAGRSDPAPRGGPDDARRPESEPAASVPDEVDTKLASSDPQWAVQKALSLTSSGQHVMATPSDPDSAPITRSNAKYYVHRADYWAGRGDLDRALSDYDAAIMVDDVNIDAFHGRGMLRLQRGEVELALADLDRAIRFSFTDPRIYLDRGLIWYERRGYDRAIADFNQAIKLAPHLAKAYLYRGMALRRKREFKSAIADLDQAIRLNPEITEAHRNRELARLERDDPVEAMSETFYEPTNR